MLRISYGSRRRFLIISVADSEFHRGFAGRAVRVQPGRAAPVLLAATCLAGEDGVSKIVRIRHLQGVFSVYLRLPSRRGSSAWRSGSSTSTWSPMRTRTRTRRLYGTQMCRYVLHLLAVLFSHKLEEDICIVVTIACEDTSLMCTNAMAASLRSLRLPGSAIA